MNERIDTQDQYEEFDQMGEAHDGSSELTPIRSDAFELSNAINTEDVAVNIESKHLCVSMRGIKDHTRSTITSEFRVAFKKKDTQLKFVDFIRTPSE